MPIHEKTFEILKMSRCADISDALDGMGLQDLYSMCPDMRPMIPQTCFCGIARTLEFQKTDVRLPYMEYEEFEKLQYTRKKDGGYHYIDSLSNPGLWEEVHNVFAAGKDEVIVCNANGLIGGIFGSENLQGMVNNGLEGIILDGFMRDTPESIHQKLPVFSTGISYVHPMGRIEIYSCDKPVLCGGVLVTPGDVVCADHDGVIVVPARYADETAYRSYKIQQIDRANRRKRFEDAGMPMDETVELLPDLARWF